MTHSTHSSWHRRDCDGHKGEQGIPEMFSSSLGNSRASHTHAKPAGQCQAMYGLGNSSTRYTVLAATCCPSAKLAHQHVEEEARITWEAARGGKGGPTQQEGLQQGYAAGGHVHPACIRKCRAELCMPAHPVSKRNISGSAYMQTGGDDCDCYSAFSFLLTSLYCTVPGLDSPLFGSADRKLWNDALR